MVLKPWNFISPWCIASSVSIQFLNDLNIYFYFDFLGVSFANVRPSGQTVIWAAFVSNTLSLVRSLLSALLFLCALRHIQSLPLCEAFLGAFANCSVPLGFLCASA